MKKLLLFITIATGLNAEALPPGYLNPDGTINPNWTPNFEEEEQPAPTPFVPNPVPVYPVIPNVEPYMGLPLDQDGNPFGD